MIRRRPLLIVLTAMMAVAAAHLLAQMPAGNRSTGMIVGQVIDGDTGAPIAGAVVAILGNTTTDRIDGAVIVRGASAQPRILTGAGGYFVFRDLPAGGYGIHASKPGYADGAFGRRRPDGDDQHLVLADGQRTGGIVVRLWKHAAISGTVVDEAGEPLIGVQVRAYRVARGGSRLRFSSSSAALTNDLGLYRLARLVPGEYVVLVPSRQVAAPLDLPPPSARGLPAGFPEVGLGAPSSMHPGTLNAMQSGAVALGIARSAAVPPPPENGRLFIYPPVFHSSAGTVVEAGRITLGSGEERSGIAVYLRPVPSLRVSGTLIGPDSARGGIPLRLVPDGDTSDLFDIAPATVSAPDGSFTFPGVVPGEYTLRTIESRLDAGSGAPTQPDVWWASAPISIGAADVDDLHVPLQRGLRLSGTFQFDGSRNRPAAAALQRTQIVIQPAGEPSNVPARVHVDGSGRFTSTALPGGRYYVQVSASPEGWMFLSAMHDGVDVSETPLHALRDITGITLTFTDRWSSLRGLVHGEGGRPDPDATVLLFPTDAARSSDVAPRSRRFRNARTSMAGAYTITPAPPGEYYAVALRDEDAAGWRDAAFLASVASSATRVVIRDGEHTVQALRTSRVP